MGYSAWEIQLVINFSLCVYCLTSGVVMTIDHVIPRSKLTVPHGLANAVVACEPCNKAKAAVMPSKWCDAAQLARVREFVACDGNPTKLRSLDLKFRNQKAQTNL